MSPTLITRDSVEPWPRWLNLRIHHFEVAVIGNVPSDILPCSSRPVGSGSSLLNGIDCSIGITDCEMTDKLKEPLQSILLPEHCGNRKKVE